MAPRREPDRREYPLAPLPVANRFLQFRRTASGRSINVINQAELLLAPPQWLHKAMPRMWAKLARIGDQTPEQFLNCAIEALRTEATQQYVSRERRRLAGLVKHSRALLRAMSWERLHYPALVANLKAFVRDMRADGATVRKRWQPAQVEQPARDRGTVSRMLFVRRLGAAMRRDLGRELGKADIAVITTATRALFGETDRNTVLRNLGAKAQKQAR